MPKSLDWLSHPELHDLTDWQKFVLSYDYSTSDLGPIEQWHPQLKSTVLAIMNDDNSVHIFWGVERRISIYNEATSILLGEKHPGHFAQEQALWTPEISAILEPTFRQIQDTGKTISQKACLMPLRRNSVQLEECYFDIRLSPIIDYNGYYVGACGYAQETCEPQTKRRLVLIEQLSANLASAKKTDDVWDGLLSALAVDSTDLPAAALFTADEEIDNVEPTVKTGEIPTSCVLRGAYGVFKDHAHLPTRLVLDDKTNMLACLIQSAASTEDLHTVRMDSMWRSRGWGDAEGEFEWLVVYTIRSASQNIMAFLVLGIGAKTPYNAEFETFIRSITKQIAMPRVSTLLFNDEVQRGRSATARAFDEQTDLSKQLLESERRFQRFAALSDIGLGVCNTQGRYLYVNDAWVRMTGISTDSEPYPWRGNVINEDQQIVEESWRKILGEKCRVSFQVRQNRTDGKGFIWVVCNCAPELDVNGEVKTVSVYMTDVTQIKHVEEQLRARTHELERSEMKWKNMVVNAPYAICTMDSEGAIGFRNDLWHKITGHSLGDNDKPTAWMDNLVDDDATKCKKLFHDLMQAEDGTSCSYELRFKRFWEDPHKSASEDNTPPIHQTVSGKAYIERNPDGSMRQALGWLADISAQKAAEAVLVRRMDEAIDLRRQQERFIDMTSHEMRNPLSAILHSADEIVSTLTASIPHVDADMKNVLEEAIEAAHTINICVSHQQRLLDDILTLSRLDSDLLLVTPVPAQPIRLVRQTLRVFEAEAKNAAISLDFVEDASLQRLGVDWLLFDPSRVVQVLVNLVTNAIKFSKLEQEKHISVTVSASLRKPSDLPSDIVYLAPRINQKPNRPTLVDGDVVYLAFAVKDTGKGLTEAEMTTLFSRFQQASPRTHVVFGGSGLGLFISRQLTELCEGQIGLVSKSGKGSTFAFFVKTTRTVSPDRGGTSRRRSHADIEPIDEPVQSQPAAKARSGISSGVARGPDPKHAGLSVLVVEDNIVNQRVLAKQLRTRGCTVNVANHGLEALDFIRKTTRWRDRADDACDLSVVLCDCEMPVMSGMECIQEIRRLQAQGMITSHIPVIAVTANARPQQIRTVIEAGMDMVATKPYQVNDILRQIDDLLAKQSQTTAANGTMEVG